MPARAKSAVACLILASLALLHPGASAAVASGMRIIAGSVRLPDADGRAIGRARIVRAALAPEELSAPVSFSVSLRMRDFSELEARIASGALVPRSEMEARFLPLRGDYERVAAWLAAQGFTQTMRDLAHTTVFVKGTVADVARCFGVQFARVAVSDGEYTSAISEPAMPGDLIPVVLSVNGLQPQFRLRHLKPAAKPIPDDLVGFYVLVTPDNIVSAYNIPRSATGAGQIIAIVGEAPAVSSDVSTFWSGTGVAQAVGNVTTVNVDGGVSNPAADATVEADIDVEWAGAIAPGADIRVYVAQQTLECFTQIQNDIPDYPTMRVISFSYGNTEGTEGASVLQASSQVAASIAAAGVSVLASSGDSGSNPNGGIAAGDYLATAPLDVAYPASDPNVTGVGGTKVGYAGSWSYTGEVVWDQLASEKNASGGGVSMQFAKPSWQTGGPVLAGQTMRCVPDVAAIADAILQSINIGPNYTPYTASDVGALAYANGQDMGIGGTSLACPIWAGVAALINQARAAAGLGPIGLLNPHLYPLSGTNAFNDVTSGTNGAYNAGPGYDLCTGLGSPNVANLISALGGQNGSNHRLVNLSARVQVGMGSNIVIAGFVIRGPAGTTKDILVRGIGPGLTSFGVAGVLANPVMGVYDSAYTLIASNTGWGNLPEAGTSTMAANFRQATADDMKATGAFALLPASADSAMVLTLPIGSYTVQVSGSGATSGVALSEVYELNTLPAEILTNISARCFVGTGAQVGIAGFVVEGSQSAMLLVRGVGPALNGFGLSGTLAQPSIRLFDSTNTLIVSNTGWENPPVAGTSTIAASYRQATADDMESVGAFAFSAGAADSAIVVTLPPGPYTAIVSGINGTTGTALAEIYEMSGP